MTPVESSRNSLAGQSTVKGGIITSIFKQKQKLCFYCQMLVLWSLTTKKTIAGICV